MFTYLLFGISYFLEEISSLSHSIVFLFPNLLFCTDFTEEGFLVSPCYSLELCIQMGISFLFSFAFHFFSFHSYFKASSDSHFAFLHFFFLGIVFIPVTVQCHEPLFIVHQAFYQVWSLKSISHFQCIIIRDLI